ncbi:Tim44 domain-containing protein [Bradyrhizobium oligotrophicum]|uniref:Tim44 domain-containing protein n=1 Tax=Bradyrhizobium oligotrophicum TaxID=44255 RepID=UPI003EBD31F2
MQRKSGLLKAMAVALSLALPTVLAVSAADARIGGGSSSGSRGTRTFSAPPPTSTAPGSASQFNRTLTQPGQPGGLNTAAAPARGGLFGGRAGGLLGGLAAGFLGAGLFGMLFGGGLFSGLGGFASIIGLILQVLLVVFLVRMAMAWWQRRNQPAYASGPAPTPADGQSSFRSGLSGLGGGFGGFGGGSNTPPLQVLPADYEAFERLLGEIQSAWSSEDVGRLRLLSTPEMASYFERDLEQNQARGVVNKVTGVKLLQGDLAESWRENGADYATVAMRFTLVDKTTERASGRVVEGSDQPQEVTEIWTFLRHPGADWQLSAIQQVS